MKYIKLNIKNIFNIFFALLILVFNLNLFSQADNPAPNMDANAVPFTLSPEEIEALKASSAESPMGPITDKDIEEFVSFINNLSEEDMKTLENLATEAAKEIEAASKAEEAPVTVTPEIKPEVPVKKEEKPKIPVNKVEEAKYILANIAKLIHDLRQEASKEESVSRRLNPWSKDLNDLVYFLNAINSKNILIGHLLSDEFANFYQNLKNLNKILQENIKSFSVEDIIGGKEYEEEDPYEILGVEPNATQEEIEDAFNIIKKTKDPKKIEEKLRASNIEEKEIKRKIKEAKLSYNLIESAYENLKNPKLRAQIDKELKEKESSGLSKKEISKRALSKILDSFGTAFYDNKILQDFTDLLKKYDPIALETKKELDKAEEAAKKSKEAAAKRTVTKSPGGFTEPSYIPPYEGYREQERPYVPSSYPEFADYGKGIESGGWGAQPGLKDKQLGGGGGGKAGAGGKTEGKESEPKIGGKPGKGEEKLKMPELGGKEEAGAEKIEDPIKLMKIIDANLNLLNNQLENNPKIVKLLSLTHESLFAPAEGQEKVFKRSAPLSIKEAGIIKAQNQQDIDYLDSWQKTVQLDKLVENSTKLEELVKNSLEKNPNSKKNLTKEFKKLILNKLTGPITELLLIAKNIPGDIKPAKNLLNNIESIYDSLYNIYDSLAEDYDVVQAIKILAKQLEPLQAAAQTAQVIDAQIKGEELTEEASETADNKNITDNKTEKTKKIIDPQAQQNLDNILKNLEGEKVFFSIILNNIERISKQIDNASSGSKKAFKTEFDNPNSVSSEIEDLDKLVKILQKNPTQDAIIRKNTGNLETIVKKLKEIEKNL